MTENYNRRAPVQAEHHRTPGLRVPAGTMSWAEHEEVWRAYQAKYHGHQDAECIARRGGFGRQEAETLLGRHLKTWIPS